MENHFWLGSLCANRGKTGLPAGVVSVSDTITIEKDLGNRIPNKSWMLYLLEAFDRTRGTPVELNLICQFDESDNFWAIFGGVNRYKFTDVLPVVSHSYTRQINFRKQAREIEYEVIDKTSGNREKFVFAASGIAFEARNQFTGLEWWNKTGHEPFPVRYGAFVSELEWAHADGPGTTRVPYDSLVPDKDSSAGSYPVTFRIRSGEGQLSYAVCDGRTSSGIAVQA